jgi:hypothetical protein
MGGGREIKAQQRDERIAPEQKLFVLVRSRTKERKEVMRWGGLSKLEMQCLEQKCC